MSRRATHATTRGPGGAGITKAGGVKHILVPDQDAKMVNETVLQHTDESAGSKPQAVAGATRKKSQVILQHTHGDVAQASSDKGSVISAGPPEEDGRAPSSSSEGRAIPSQHSEGDELAPSTPSTVLESPPRSSGCGEVASTPSNALVEHSVSCTGDGPPHDVSRAPDAAVCFPQNDKAPTCTAVNYGTPSGAAGCDESVPRARDQAPLCASEGGEMRPSDVSDTLDPPAFSPDRKKARSRPVESSKALSPPLNNSASPAGHKHGIIGSDSPRTLFTRSEGIGSNAPPLHGVLEAKGEEERQPPVLDLFPPKKKMSSANSRVVGMIHSNLLYTGVTTREMPLNYSLRAPGINKLI